MIDSGRRVAVAGWIGSSNLGDELIFAAVRRKLDVMGVPCVALSIDPAATGASHRCSAVSHRGPRDGVALWRGLGDASYLVFGGGGLLQSETSPWNLPFHLSRVWSARMRRIPWAGIGLGVGDLRGRVAKALVTRTLRTSVGVTVRDPGSAATLRSIGVGDAVVAADPVVSFDRPEVGEQDRIVVTLRRMNLRGYGTAEAQTGAAVDDAWLTSIAGALDQAASETGLGVHFVALQPDRDMAVHEAVAERMSTATSFGDSTLQSVLGEIAASRLVIAMRYHTAIGALLADRPTVILDYSPKMRFLAADVGGGMQVMAADRIEGPRLMAAIRQAQRGAGNLEPALARLRKREACNWQMLDRLLECS